MQRKLDLESIIPNSKSELFFIHLIFLPVFLIKFIYSNLTDINQLKKFPLFLWVTKNFINLQKFYKLIIYLVTISIYWHNKFTQ